MNLGLYFVVTMRRTAGGRSENKRSYDLSVRFSRCLTVSTRVLQNYVSVSTVLDTVQKVVVAIIIIVMSIFIVA